MQTRRITQKEIKANFNRIISVADIEFVFLFQKRFAYNSGVNGWNFDCFEINGNCFCKGYRTIGEKPKFDILKEYEQKAKNIYYSNISHENKKAMINKLCFEMCEKLTK